MKRLFGNHSQVMARALAGLFTAAVMFVTQVAAAAAPLEGGPLTLNVVKVKTKGSWTEVMIAIENHGDTDAQLECCTVYLENTDGYAVASLNQGEVQSQIHNKAKTGAIVGGILGVGLALGGAFSGVDELGYAGLGVGAGSAIAGTVGAGSADKARRDLIIDDVMRNQTFPAGLKVAGVAYFPPKKKWPGSKKAEQLHLTYKMGKKTYRTSAYVSN